MKKEQIVIQGARENNLKNVDLTIPRDKFIVFTGVSGSGKTSLAFDTIYAEGQRRYVESLSSYARMFLGQMEKPEVDYIEGLSPAISIDQKTTNKNPRSTVGTVTEIYDYLRLLYARVGVPHCPQCGKIISQQSLDQIVDKVLSLPEGSRVQILAPVIRRKKGEHQKIFENARKSGYVRVRADGIIYDLSEEIELEKQKKHNIEIVIDRLVVRNDIRTRLADSIEIALHQADGIVMILCGEEEMTFSRNYACEDCGISLEELSPRMFSFNNPLGACPRCSGIGLLKRVDPSLVLISDELSILEGAFSVSGWRAPDKEGSMANATFRGLAKKYNFSLSVPVKKLPQNIIDIILYGTGSEEIEIEHIGKRGLSKYMTTFEGIVTNLQRRYDETDSDWAKWDIEGLMREIPCNECKGKRLRRESLSVTVGGKNIDEVCNLSVNKAKDFFGELKLEKQQKMIAEEILKEINARIGFLNNVGLEYLTMSRSAGTLSGGEAQRIRLATQIGSGLVGVLYILDEPSIGLHQRDNNKLIDALKSLRDMGNTLIVVEHDEDTMFA
ncbi:MAG: excinuclease ABC subunit UvrA, partial [Clostridia bacterium]|nr:excinuclease ABC subunit UvrA [Clostridia bacterium]